MQELLKKLQIIKKDKVVEYFPRTRDNHEIKVMKCSASGVIFLNKSGQGNFNYYKEKPLENEGVYALSTVDGCVVKTLTTEDSKRRSEQFKHYIRGKNWVDFGTGQGEILQLLRNEAASAIGVEASDTHRQHMTLLNIPNYSSVDAIADGSIDVVSMFHVLEHLPDPIVELKKIARKLVTGGQIIVEVPHASDFLLKTLDIDAFKEFTFWSEHLLLHTRTSLKVFLEEAGFHNIQIKGYQRYSLTNHLYWLRHNLPGGHNHWNFLTSEGLNREYEHALQALDQTDTLIAVAETKAF